MFDNRVPAGELNVQLDIYTAPTVSGKPKKDAAGAIVSASAEPTRFAEGVWARVTEQSGQARYSTEQYVERMSHIVTIRYRPGVIKGMQVRYQGRCFEVKYPLDPSQRHRFLHLLCLEDGL